MPAPFIPGTPSFQNLATSPRIQRFGVFRKSITIKDIPIGNHSGLTNAVTAWGVGVLPEGSVMTRGADGNWYHYGITLTATPPNTTQSYLSLAAGGVPPLCVLIDPYDTTMNGVGNPIVGAAYFSACLLLSFLQFATGAVWTTQLNDFMRLNDFSIEGSSQVLPGAYPGGPYGTSIPREDAPV